MNQFMELFKADPSIVVPVVLVQEELDSFFWQVSTISRVQVSELINRDETGSVCIVGIKLGSEVTGRMSRKR